MDRSQAKSAPPRLKSKFVKNRTNAMKEIRAWVRKDEEFSVPEASRMSGQLSDNVTEERMLKAKLWELSKERYKFLSQNSYEKKMFQDRQQRKANSRRVFSASADGRSRHSSDEARKERRSSLSDLPSKPKTRNARLALLERLDPTKKNKGKSKNPSGDGRQTPAKLFSRANSSTSVLKHQDSRISVKHGGTDKNNESSPSFPRRTGTPNERKHQNPVDNLITDNKRPISSKNKFPFQSGGSLGTTKTSATPMAIPPQMTPSQQLSTVTTKTKDGSSTTQASWSKSANGNCSSKYGMRVESRITDPRYASLEKRLSPLVSSSSTADVSSIVNTIESLHVRPKRRPIDPNRSRTKIEVKALEFIKEKGFVFGE